MLNCILDFGHVSVHWHGAGTKFQSATVKHKGDEEQTGKIGLHAIIRNCDIWFEENAFQVQEEKKKGHSLPSKNMG